MLSRLRSIWLELVVTGLVAAAESAMVGPLLHLLAGLTGNAASEPPSMVGLAVIGLGSFWSARLFLQGGWEIAAARGMSLAVWLVLLIGWYGQWTGSLLSAPVRFIDDLIQIEPRLLLLLVLGGLAWWRGLALGSDPMAFTADFARSLLRRGVVVFGACLLLTLFTGDATTDLVTGSIARSLPVFLVTGLAAGGAIQVMLVRAEVGTGADSGRNGLGWLGASAGLALGILLAAGIVAAAAGWETVATALAPLVFVIDLLHTALIWAVSLLAFAIFLLLWPAFWLLQQLVGEPAERLTEPTEIGPAGIQDYAEQTQSALPDFVGFLLQLGLVALAVGVVAWLALRSLRRRRGSQSNRPADEFRESVWSSDLALAQLKDMFGGLLPKRSPHERADALDLGAEPVDVRDAYRRLLVLGARQGQAREQRESPSDYAARLEQDWVEVSPAIDDLTRRYLDARYGEQSTADDAAQARRAWQQIRARSRADRPER